jgi:hypothetical protein
MTRHLVGLIGLAILSAAPLLGQSSAIGGETGCCAGAACCAQGGGNACCDCCPRCGCKLVPVCQMTCTKKKETINKYCCTCKDVCIPGVTRLCERGEGCNNGCQEGCDCHCRVREVHKLMIYPETKEKQVRGCTVQWVCPNCNPRGGSGSTSAPSVAPPMVAPPAAAPKSSALPPPRTTDAAPLPEDIRTVDTGY